MPNRIISERCKRSPTLAGLSSDAERLWWRLMTEVDDYGRFEAVPKIVNGTCAPLLNWTDGRVKKCLIEFAQEREPDGKPLVIYYATKGRLYGQLTSFHEHQRKRDSKPKFPSPQSGKRLLPPQLAAICGDSRQVAALSESESESESRESRDESGVFNLPQRKSRKGQKAEECPPELRQRLGFTTRVDPA